MQPYSKRIKKQLRELAGLAYARELERKLEELGKAFNRCAARKLLAGT